MKVTMRISRSPILLLVLVSLFCFCQADASAQSGGSKKWRYLVEPYIMFPNMAGNCAVRSLPEAEINASSSDIFSKLQWGAMLNMEITNDKWTFGSDLLYMDLGSGLNSSRLISSGEVGAQQLGWELVAMRRILPFMDVGLGALWNSLQMEINLEQNQVGGGTVSRSGDKRESWLDPMLVVRLRTSPEIRVKKLYAMVRTELGGFGIGSDLAWQIQATGGYRFSKLFEMSAGFRAISLDYSTGSGSDAFVYDVDTYGPMVRFGFNF
jgi:hypothetical protein